MITYSIIIVTVVISFLCFKSRKLLSAFAFSPYMTIEKKQYYRLLTHGFVHADVMHLVVNMFTYWSFGTYIERSFHVFENGWLLYLLLYFGGMIVASIYDLIKKRHDLSFWSIGASGAVSSVLFCYIFMNPRGTILFFTVVPLPAILFGMLYLFYCHYMSRHGSDNINHNAHFYGALYGFIFLIIVSPSSVAHFLRSLGL